MYDDMHSSCPALYLIMRYCIFLHVISRKALQQFWDRYPDSQSPLFRWFKIVQKTYFEASMNCEGHF